MTYEHIDAVFTSVWPRCLLVDANSPTVAMLNTMNHTLWTHLIDEAMRHEVAVYLHYKLRQFEDSLIVPTCVKDRLHLLARQATLVSLRRSHELRQILSALHSSGITPTLLKGAALAHTVYPSPACRSMVDFDLWLENEEIIEAQAVFEKLGYRIKHDPTRTLAFQRHYEGELVLISPHDGRTTVELHWGAFVGEWTRRTTTVDRVAVNERRYSANINGHPVHLLAPEDAFLQIVLHAAIHHQMSRHPLRSLLDLVLLLQHGVDLVTVSRQAREWRIERVTSYIHILISLLFDTPQAQARAATLHLSTLETTRNDLLRRIIGPADILAGRRIDTSPMRYILLALLADRKIDAAKLFARMLWPESEWLYLRYGTSGPASRYRHLKSAFAGRL